MVKIEKTHKHFHPHHVYQLGVVLLFATSIFLFLPYFIFMTEYRVDMATWQWYFIAPWAVVYSAYCLALRNRIPRGERIDPLRRPFLHWILIALMMVEVQIQPLDLRRLYGLDAAFMLFTLFLADSFWDFRDSRK